MRLPSVSLRARIVALLGALLLSFGAASAAEAQEPDCSTPRRSVDNWLDNLQEDDYHPNRAIACFDWEAAGVARVARARIAVQLKEVLDMQGLLVPVDDIPDDPEGGGARHVRIFSTTYPELYLLEKEGRWLISEETIEAVPGLHEGVITVDIESYVDTLPTWVKNRPLFGVAWWQFFGLALALILSLVVRQLLAWFVASVGTRVIERSALKASSELMNKASLPIGTIAMAGILWFAVPLLSFGVRTNQILNMGIRVLAAVSAVIVLYRIVDVVSEMFERKAAKTETKLDDQLVPLLRRSARVLVVTIGVIFVLQNMNVDVTSLLAMGTVGTLAISFAAKDMVANLFGSVSIFAERPFQVGDWVKIGDVEGVVEEVGMRSTRVRTFYNSLITMPNSIITITSVDNFGARQYRRCSIVLNLTYDTSPEQMQAFCDGCRAILKANPAVRKDTYEVHFSAFGSASLDVMLYFFFAVDTWSAELRERHNVYLEILRLAAELEVEFAFPTQTLHIDSLAEAGEAPDAEAPDDKALEAKVLAFAPGGKLSRPAGPRITHGFFPGAEVKGSDQQDSGGEG